jgi:glycosyltransferase involved in cell wall biosynthesis
MAGLRISGCIIACNEESCIETCLRSLAPVCDELLVVDSHSTDRTRELATACGARVIERDWPGYRSQRQFALESAQNDWILTLDADEQLSPELTAEIAALRNGVEAPCAAYRIPFASRYFGRYLRFGDAGREKHVRLFDRRRADMGGFEIHEHVKVHGSIAALEGRILHDSFVDLDDQLTKAAHYAHLMGDAMHAAGRQASLLQLIFNPWWRFFRAYVLRLGLLDGWRGLCMALIDADYVRQKYLRLYVLTRKNSPIV